MSLQTITESPTLKLRTEFTNYMERKLRRKSLKNKQFDIGDHRHKNKKSLQISERLRKLYKAKKLHKQHKLEDTDDDFEFEDLHDKKVTSLLQRPLQWYLEDEIIGAKDILWEQKQRAYNEKMNKNVEIGKQKSKYFNFNLFNNLIISLV